ncbi:MAG: diacylglycerol/lipid kinase family protein [Chloroflexota bacterium]
MTRSLVLLNPRASRLRVHARRAEVEAALVAALRRRDGMDPEIVVAASAAEVPALVADAIRGGATVVVGVGGDGTLREVAAALAGTDVALGIVPGGTGNILAGSLGIPGAMVAAAETLATARTRAIDLGSVRVEPAGVGDPWDASFLVGAGIGFDAEVMASTPDALKRRAGRAAYFARAALLAARIDTRPYRLELDGDPIAVEGSIALVANLAELIPGVLRPRLPVVPDDGLLDVIVVGARGPVAGVRGLVDQLVRSELGSRYGGASIRVRARDVRIAAGPPAAVQVDGDPYPPGALTASVRPGALRVLVPGA